MIETGFSHRPSCWRQTSPVLCDWNAIAQVAPATLSRQHERADLVLAAHSVRGRSATYQRYATTN